MLDNVLQSTGKNSPTEPTKKIAALGIQENSRNRAYSKT